VGKQSDLGVAVGRSPARRPTPRSGRPHATTRRRDVDVGGDQSARETRVVDRAATRDARIRDRAARDARATLGFHGRDAPVARRRGFATTRDARATRRARASERRLERRSSDARVVDDARGARGAGRRAREAVVVRARNRRFANRARGLAIRAVDSVTIRRRFGADMAMRRAESMPELGETRGSVSREIAAPKTLGSTKMSDESTEDAFAMATSETAGDGEAARAERDETTMLRELSVRARGDETTSRERCVVDREPTVLVVDDCSMNLRIVSKVLGAIFSDVRVEFAHDGREGIKRFEELRNDASCELALIIVDYNMPCCDGVTASKYMRALEERRNGRAREQSDVAALWQRVPIVMYTTELHVILPALVDGTIDDRLPKVCTREMFSRSVVRHLAPRHARWVLPEWRGIESRAARCSCNDVANVELELDMRSRAFVSFDETIEEKSVKKRHRQGDEEPRANGAKSLRGLDGEIIVLGSSSAEVSTDHNRGLLKRLSKSFNKFFKSKSSTLTVRAKLKEDKRAALSKKFEAKGASSFHTSMDNAFPRYSM